MRDDITIRSMEPHEIALAVDWAAVEGWNPGYSDSACFSAVDPSGFLLAEMDGAPIATISVVNYDDHFAFLGFYIVRPEMRGRGIGFRLWQAGLAHAGARTIGLDGVPAQQGRYAAQGFRLAYRNIRFSGVAEMESGADVTYDLKKIPFEAIVASDAEVFPAPRQAFLRAWLDAPGHEGRALMREGRLAGWGLVRPARAGWKIGPLVAKSEADAENLFLALRASTGAGEIVLDVPEPNQAALTLAVRHGLKPVFETARMYRGPVPMLALERLYGVTSFELG